MAKAGFSAWDSRLAPESTGLGSDRIESAPA